MEGVIAALRPWWEWLMFESTFMHHGGIPVLCAGIAYLFGSLMLETLIAQPWADKYFIQWSKEERRTKIDEYRNSIAPKWTQFRVSLWVVLGPESWIASILLGLVMPYVVRRPETLLPESFGEFLVYSVMLHLVDDFFLYWGHRIQHESEFLWTNFHAKHHQIRTPTPSSAVFIDSADSTLQGSIPIIVSRVILQPHPLVYYLYIIRRIFENVVNHSGMEGFLPLDIIALKVLPGRAPVSHHDSHHHFCNYSRNAKNYAEHFLLWDWLFGTLSPRTQKKTT